MKLFTLLLVLSSNIYAKSSEECLVDIAWGEAQGESLKGKIAIMYASLHHAKFNSKPVCKLQHVAKQSPPKDLKLSLIKTANLVIRGIIKDPSNGATHWRANKPHKFGVKVAVVENHVFSKLD